jgi:hypothetical protein
LDQLLRGQEDSSREEKFLMHYPHAPHRTDYFTVYRDGSWKLIYHYFPSEVSGGKHYQLFDLKRDPFEQKDIADENVETVKRMMVGMTQALQKQKALFPIDSAGKELNPVIP